MGKTNHGLFSAKLSEMEVQYEQIRNQIQICQSNDCTQLRREQQVLLEQYKKYEALLKRQVNKSCSPAVAALSNAHLTYCQETSRILQKEIPEHTDNDISTERVEGLALFAEYAIDFATQSAKFALLAAMSAIDLEKECEKSANSISREDKQ